MSWDLRNRSAYAHFLRVKMQQCIGTWKLRNRNKIWRLLAFALVRMKSANRVSSRHQLIHPFRNSTAFEDALVFKIHRSTFLPRRLNAVEHLSPTNKMLMHNLFSYAMPSYSKLLIQLFFFQSREFCRHRCGCSCFRDPCLAQTRMNKSY